MDSNKKPLRPSAPPPPAVSPPAAPAAPAPVIPPQERRDFFNDAMREILLPFTGIIERKINPLLAALEQIPEEAERLANNNFGLLDQPHTGGGNSYRTVELDVKPAHARMPERMLRPPGAMAPGEFETFCSRCGDCIKACPASAIIADPNSLIADGYPYIVADSQPCVVCDSLACMKSCPTGALKLVDRLQIKMGTAVVHHEDCLRDHGENCTLCIDVCPVNGGPDAHLAALFVSPLTGQVRVRKNICIGCGLCESRCPTDPRAITVTPYTPPFDPIVA